MAQEQTNIANDNCNQDELEVIEANLQQYANVNITTSLDRIGLVLTYLAQCDYAIGNSASDIDDDGWFGRGYLLDMLGDGVSGFAKKFEVTELLYLEQQTKHRQQAFENKALKTKSKLLADINDKYKQLLDLEDSEQDQNEQLKQQIEVLNTQLAQL